MLTTRDNQVQKGLISWQFAACISLSSTPNDDPSCLAVESTPLLQVPSLSPLYIPFVTERFVLDPRMLFDCSQLVSTRLAAIVCIKTRKYIFISSVKLTIHCRQQVVLAYRNWYPHIRKSSRHQDPIFSLKNASTQLPLRPARSCTIHSSLSLHCPEDSQAVSPSLYDAIKCQTGETAAASG